MHFHHLLLDRKLSVSKVVAAGLVLHLAIAAVGIGLMVWGASDLALILGFLLVLAGYASVVVFAFAGAGTVPQVQADPELSK